MIAESPRDAISENSQIGDVFAPRLAAKETFAIEQALLGFAHEDTLPAIARAARTRMEADHDDDAVMRSLAFHAPGALDPHRAWLAQAELDVTVELDQPATAAVGPAIHVVTPPGVALVRAGVPTPTWLGSYGQRVGGAHLGGALEAACGTCGRPLHRLLELDEVPAQLPLSVERLTIATCLSCLGWEEVELWFRHGADGSVATFEDRGSYSDPKFPSGPLASTTADLVDFGPRYARQSWGTSNGFENLNRLGGAPSWVQGDAALECRGCAAPMRHLLQLDSCFPLADTGHAFLFGSGGLAYVQWCDACRVSAHSWQCT